MKKLLPRKVFVDIIFIVLASGFLILTQELNWHTAYFGFALLPLIIAYYAGQYVQKKWKSSPKNKSE